MPCFLPAQTHLCSWIRFFNCKYYHDDILKVVGCSLALNTENEEKKKDDGEQEFERRRQGGCKGPGGPSIRWGGSGGGG